MREQMAHMTTSFNGMNNSLADTKLEMVSVRGWMERQSEQIQGITSQVALQHAKVETLRT